MELGFELNVTLVNLWNLGQSVQCKWWRNRLQVVQKLVFQTKWKISNFAEKWNGFWTANFSSWISGRCAFWIKVVIEMLMARAKSNLLNVHNLSVHAILLTMLMLFCFFPAGTSHGDAQTYSYWRKALFVQPVW